MKLNDLIYAGEYEYVSSPDAMELTVNGVCSSSLDASEGFVFVCLRGVHTDGTMYMADAYRRGAAVCVCSSPPALLSGNYVIVKNARRTLAFMLSRFWQDAWKSMDIYALTGTNGKTSTAMFLREIFISAGYVTGYIGTLKSYINRERFYLGAADDEKMSTMTTPDPEQLYKIIYGMRERGVQKLIIEASSHALKLDKLAPLHFSSSAFLNFSSDHLDFHLNTGDYLLSKCRIFSMSDKVIINADDPMCAAAARAFAAHSASYGIENDGADYVGKNVFYSLTDGVLYDLCYGEKSIQICSSVIGEFTVYNSLAAASIALSEGIDGQYVQKGIKALERIDGRLERLDLAGGFDISVFIDYAHTENAMEKLLMSVSQSKMAGQRIVTLFGCGGDRDREKRCRKADT